MICCYSTQMIRSHLQLSSLKFTNFVHSFLLKRGAFNYHDDAPWNKMIIDNVIKRQEWNLHVISSHFGMIKDTQEFEEQGIHYYFFKGQILFPFNYLDKFLHPQEYVSFERNRKYIKSFLKSIQPDVVLLVGAENPYYSSSALDIENIPIYVLCQTVANGNGSLRKDAEYKNLLSIEKQIIMRTSYVGVYCKKHYQQLLDMGYRGNIFEFQWPPVNLPKEDFVYNGPKEFDFINFAARATDDKGYKDSVQALAIVKQKYPNVKLNLKLDTGKYKDEIVALVSSLGLQDNVSYQRSFPETSDLFKHIVKSRFAVLPCKLDNTSGTMTQSMRLGLPMVVYKTSGTPGYNLEKECALIAEMNNIEDLAAKMLILMDDVARAEQIKVNAQEFIRKRTESRMNAMNRIVADVNAILNHYSNAAPISKELLFDPKTNA